MACKYSENITCDIERSKCSECSCQRAIDGYLKQNGDGKMKYWKRICDIQNKQTQKGIATYGQVLEENTELTPEERLTMLEEELIDGLMYIEHIKAGMKNDDSI